MLKAYLRGAFPAVRDLDDIVQESYLRVWRARLGRPILSAKAFLFQVARHLALDVIRHNRGGPQIVSGDLSGLSVIDDKPDAAQTLSYHEKVELVAEVLADLPKGCREILILSKFNQLRQKEVAARLGISERTVESQLARAMKLCEKQLRRRGMRGLHCDER